MTQIDEVRRILEYLVSSDWDKAKEKNEIGLDKFDSEDGHNLVEQKEPWNLKQTQRALRICEKHRKQLSKELRGQLDKITMWTENAVIASILNISATVCGSNPYFLLATSKTSQNFSPLRVPGTASPQAITPSCTAIHSRTDPPLSCLKQCQTFLPMSMERLTPVSEP